MASITLMVKRCAGLIDTKDVTAWENQFLTDILAKTRQGDDTTGLTEKQVDRVQQIFNKHFGD